MSIRVLDVEPRLDNMGLGQEVTKATAGRMKLDHSTQNLLAFNPKPDIGQNYRI